MYQMKLFLQSDFASVEHTSNTPQKLFNSQKKPQGFQLLYFWEGAVPMCHQEESIKKSVNFTKQFLPKSV